MGTAFLYGNGGSGGGAALNFEMKAYATEELLLAATPKENTIGIITTTAINGWALSAEAPSSPASGMVWIQTGITSGVAFNALKKNSITLYPISAKQYVNGAWVEKTAKSYQNGNWVEWFIYFYKYGDERFEVTGGFSKSKDNGVGTRTVTKNSDSMYLLCIGISNSGTHFTVASEKMIDVTTLKTLYARIKFTTTASTSFSIGLGGLRNVYAYETTHKAVDSSYEGIISLDVSALTGMYYLLFTMAGKVVNNNGYCYVYEVYAE